MFTNLTIFSKEKREVLLQVTHKFQNKEATKINYHEQWLTFNKQMEQNCVIRCTLFSSERQTTDA